MLEIESLPCRAAHDFAALRHGWLGNKVLNFNAAVIAEIYYDDASKYQIEREEFEKRIKVFEEWLGKARVLINDLITGFSPVQLVDGGLLGHYLQSEKLQQVRDIIHQAYLEQTQIGNLKNQAEVNLNALERAFRDFVGLWQKPLKSDLHIIRDSFQRVLDEARALHKTLSSLPKGVVLP